MRRPRPANRFLAAAAAGLLVLLAGPVAATAQTSQQPGSGGQSSSGRPPEGDYSRGIPPLEPKGSAPAPNVGPDKTYVPVDGASCVNSLPPEAKQEARRPWGQMMLNFEEVWRFTKGRKPDGTRVKVAVIDTGVNPHPRLTNDDRLKGGGDYVANTNGLEDCDGHGTAVAGIIAASLDEETGFAGVAPEAEIISIRQSSHYFKEQGGQAHAGNTTTLARAVMQAVELGADVINISEAACVPAGPHGYHGDLHAAVREAVKRNVVVVVAAGNQDGATCQANEPYADPVTLPAPAWFDDDVLTVGAIKKDGSAASEFSIAGPWVDVAAPGTEIVTLDPSKDGTGLAVGIIDYRSRQVTPIQGTSFAAPYVAGVVALVRARFPDLDAKQVMERIERTAQHPAGPGGWNPLIGWGLVDPMAALTATIPEEQGITAPTLTEVPTAELPPFQPKDWTPTVVAISGAGAGVGLLGITLFAVHAVNRSKRRTTT